jgi:hypothetical protein
MIKKIYVLTLISLTLVAAGQIPTSGLVGGWPFTGNANDMSGTGNHGTVNGATLTTDRFGSPNCAYSFDGINDHIVMMAAGPTGSVSRSVSFWAKTTNTIIQVGFNYGDAGANGIYQVVFNYNCQGVGIDNSNAAVIWGNNTLTNNSWHHIVAVLNSTVGIAIGDVDLYVDGVLQPSISCNVSGTVSPVNSNNVYPITIAKSSNSPQRFFKGDLDDFYFYNRPLTPSEVISLYNYSPCTAAPSNPGAISGNTLICLGSTNVYSVAAVSGAASYTWNLPGGWSGASITNTISALSNISGGVISVAAKNGCGESAYSIINVNANPSPAITISSENTTICKGNSTTLLASGATTYTWNSGVTSSNILVTPTITTSYTVIGTNSVGCKSSAVKTVTVTNNPLPNISVAGPGFSCPGQTVNLASNGASTYTWEPGTLTGFFVSVSPTITTAYTVTGTDGNGCINSTIYTQTVSACQGIYESAENNNVGLFPNPVKNKVTISGLEHNSVIEIYNVSGAMIFSHSTSENAVEIDMSKYESGVYLVRIKYSDKSILKKLVKD